MPQSSRVIRPARRWSGSLRPLDSVRLHMSTLARKVWGDRAGWDNSSLTAFAYCYRRFGPPPQGTDDYKQLGGAWLLKTSDPEVYLRIDPGGCSIDLYLSQYVSEDLRLAAERPGDEWRTEARRRHLAAFPGTSREEYFLASLDDDQPWLEGMPRMPRCPEPIVIRALAALRHVLLDLLRPVYIRDVDINLFGRITSENPARGRAATPSHLAGWGIPVREMERRIQMEREQA